MDGAEHEVVWEGEEDGEDEARGGQAEGGAEEPEGEKELQERFCAFRSYNEGTTRSCENKKKLFKNLQEAETSPVPEPVEGLDDGEVPLDSQRDGEVDTTGHGGLGQGEAETHMKEGWWRLKQKWRKGGGG